MCKCKRVLIVAVCLCVRRVKLTDFQWLEIDMTTGQPLAVNPAGGVVPGSQTVNCHWLLTRILETQAHCACMGGGRGLIQEPVPSNRLYGGHEAGKTRTVGRVG